jgi:hypothetical protein
MTALDTEVRSLAAQLRFPLALYGGNRPARRSRQIFTRFRLNSRSVALFARQRCASNNDQVGATLSLVTAGAIVFVLFVASYSRCSTWVALCSMSVSMAVVFGCLFLSTVHDHNHVRMWLAWTASKLPLTVYWQIADDLTATLEHLATSPRWDIGRQGCNEAMSAPSHEETACSSDRLDRDETR